MKDKSPSLTEQMKAAVCRPELRHSLHCRCGIYRSADESVPCLSLRMDNECTIPLWRVIAVIGVTLVLLGTLTSLCRCIYDKCHMCHSPSKAKQ